MNREHIKKHEHGVYRTFSFFAWRKCEVCKNDFRRVKGYRYLENTFYNGSGVWRYLCSECITSMKDAHKFALSGGSNKRPCLPPPSPQK